MYIMQSYDDSLEYILKNGVRKSNRTGVDTLSVFGMQSRYRIDEYFPIVTKRKVWPKAIFAELLWFLSGSTNIHDLEALGSKIWSPWRDKEFEEKHEYAEGSLGPVYGFQLRHFGGNYNFGHPTIEIQTGVDEFYTTAYGEYGFDQLVHMVDLLKKDPDSRRNLFSLWNPMDLDQQRLACCHYTFQVSVHEDKLSGMLTQRSCDLPIGGPANIIFYSALLYMLAQQTGLKPYEFIHSMGDAHIYTNQIPAVEDYISRKAYSDSPKLLLNKAPDILSYKLEDFTLVDYNPLPAIKIPVAV